MPEDNGKPTLLSALLAVQAEIPNLKLGKDAQGQVAGNRNYRYLTLDKMMDEVLPLLNKHGLVWLTMPKGTSDAPYLAYQLRHVANNETIGGEMPLMLDKDNSQGLGSAITYARRYSLAAVLGLTPDEDDDGAAASKPVAKPRETASTVKLKVADRVMTDEELSILRDVVKDSGSNMKLLLASVGAESEELLTVEQGRTLMRRIKE